MSDSYEQILAIFRLVLAAVVFAIIVLALNFALGCGDLLPTLNALTNAGQVLTNPSDSPSEGLPGINCWDLNGDRIDDLEEDTNGDGFWDAFDCHGEVGPQGHPGADGQQGIPGIPGEEGPSGEDG